MIVNAGVGGSLCKGLGLGDLAVAESCVQYDMDMAAAGTPLGVIPWGKVSKEFPDGDQATAYLPCDAAMADCLEKAAEEAGIHCRRGVLATSGAIGVGVEKLGLENRPRDTAGKQAAEGIGEVVEAERAGGAA